MVVVYWLRNLRLNGTMEVCTLQVLSVKLKELNIQDKMQTITMMEIPSKSAQDPTKQTQTFIYNS